jgi:hypothetical protein
MGFLVDALRLRRPQQPLCIIHCDLPSNNFNQLFQNLHDPTHSNYFQKEGHPQGGVFPLACGGSFFETLLPPQSQHFATSFLAVEWMDRIPDIPIPEFIGYMEASPEVQAAFARQADLDMARFLEARATELAPGGKLLVIIPGSDGVRRCSDGLYNVLNDAACDLVAAGQIDRSRYERFAMPVYFRTLEELTAPLRSLSSPVRSSFSVDRAETLELPTPFEDELRRTGDVATYAVSYTGFLRAFSEPVAAAGLLEPGQNRSVIDELYERVRLRLVAAPDRYTIRNIEVAMLLTRQ